MTEYTSCNGCGITCYTNSYSDDLCWKCRERDVAYLGTSSCPTQRDEGGELLAALKAAQGYMTNAAIDLRIGAPKKTALATIDGGIEMIRAAIDKAERAQ